MNVEHDECLSAAEVVSYVNRELTDEDRSRIDRHLDECRLCAGAVEGVAPLESKEEYLKSAGSILTRVRLRAATDMPAAPQSRARAAARRYLAMAAAILVVTGTTVYLTRPSAGESLFQRYFEAYPSTQPVVRGSATDTSSDALALYESGDYRRALASFEESLTAHPDAARVHFYAGVCRLALGRNAEAIADLEQSRKLGAGELDAPAEWYLALAELRIRNIGEARSRLQRIVAGGGFYADRARALLGELG